MFELLESRRLLAASLSNGVLAVTGTRKDDFIRIVQKPTTLLVTINDTLHAFKPTHVRSAIVSGNRGDDRILISLGSITFLGDATSSPALDLNKKLLVNGGGGNDSIDAGGGAHTTVHGGDGDDFIQVSSYHHDNQILAEDGDDTLMSGAGSEDMSGGLGNDTVQFYAFNNRVTLDDLANDGYFNVNFDALFPIGGGSEGDNIHSDIETLIGSTGDDDFTGSEGNNSFFGGGGNDTLAGATGHDHLVGGPGNDLLSGAKGYDSLDGGAGDDTLVGGLDVDTAIDPEPHDVFPGLDQFSRLDVEQAAATGIVDRYAPNGSIAVGENTGWVIRRSNSFTDIDVTGQVGKTKAMLGQRVTAGGNLEIRDFLERGPTPVIRLILFVPPESVDDGVAVG